MVFLSKCHPLRHASIMSFLTWPFLAFGLSFTLSPVSTCALRGAKQMTSNLIVGKKKFFFFEVQFLIVSYHFFTVASSNIYGAIFFAFLSIFGWVSACLLK